ncbi:MAG TPA: hypothetical protein VG936_08655 [Lacunisphaera sp.]|nr:hypothetical protein [Lacunisphaera sp.]
MSQQAATITSLPMAFEVVKAMQAEGLDWDEGYRPVGRQALEAIIEATARAHPARLVAAEFNRDVNAVCPNCAPWGRFKPAEPSRTLRILGYV